MNGRDHDELLGRFYHGFLCAHDGDGGVCSAKGPAFVCRDGTRLTAAQAHDRIRFCPRDDSMSESFVFCEVHFLADAAAADTAAGAPAVAAAAAAPSAAGAGGPPAEAAAAAASASVQSGAPPRRERARADADAADDDDADAGDDDAAGGLGALQLGGEGVPRD